MSPTLFLTSCMHAVFLLMVFVSHGGASSTSSHAPLVYWNSILHKTPIPASVRYFLNTGVRNSFHINTSIRLDTSINGYNNRYGQNGYGSVFSGDSSNTSTTNKSNNDINVADFFLEKDLQVKKSSMYLHFYRAAPMTGDIPLPHQVRRMALGAGQSHVILWNFPMLYSYVTWIANTKVYSASLVAENGSKIEAVAVCHEDTSNWSPERISFKVLKVEPGDGSICHFLGEDSVAWTPTK